MVDILQVAKKKKGMCDGFCMCMCACHEVCLKFDSTASLQGITARAHFQMQVQKFVLVARKDNFFPPNYLSDHKLQIKCTQSMTNET